MVFVVGWFLPRGERSELYVVILIRSGLLFHNVLSSMLIEEIYLLEQLF